MPKFCLNFTSWDSVLLFSAHVMYLLLVCMVMWSKGSKCTSGEVCFCCCCCWDAVIEIFCSIFPPLPTAVAVFFVLKKKKKPKEKYTVLHALILQIQPVTFSSFPFSLTGQFRKGSPVRVFRWWWGSLSTDFFFPPVKRSHLEIKQLHLALLTYCENCKTLSTTLWILSLQLLYAIHSELFSHSFKQVFTFF